jgi:hypothetical protein
MSGTRVCPTNDNQTHTSIDMGHNWKYLIDEEMKNGEFMSITCHLYSTKDKNIKDQEKKCPCGRFARSHSFVVPPEGQEADAIVDKEQSLSKQKLTVYGQLSNESKVRSIFIKVRRKQLKTPVKIFFKLLYI